MEDVQPWERQEGETPLAFEAFTAYRDLGARRGKQRVADQLGKSRTLIRRWGLEWNWEERVLAWDREQDRLWAAEQFEQRRHLARNHATIATSMLAKVARRLQSLTNEEVDRLSPNNLARLFDSAVRAQRDAYGLGVAIDLRHEGEVTTKHELDIAAIILNDPAAADLSLALAERIYGHSITGESSTARSEGDV